MKLRYSKTYLVYAEVKYVTIGEKHHQSYLEQIVLS